MLSSTRSAAALALRGTSTPSTSPGALSSSQKQEANQHLYSQASFLLDSIPINRSHLILLFQTRQSWTYATQYAWESDTERYGQTKERGGTA